MLAIDIPLARGWLGLLVAVWWLGLLLAPLAWFIIVAPDILVFIAIHLRYDTTCTAGTSHCGIVEGISMAKAIELRERILQKLRTSPTAGLGDERVFGASGHRLPPDTVWSPAHLVLLREIREAARAIKGSP